MKAFGHGLGSRRRNWLAAGGLCVALLALGGVAVSAHVKAKDVRAPSGTAKTRTKAARTQTKVVSKGPIITPIGLGDGGTIGGEEGAASYSAQPGLSSSTVTGGKFGQLFSTQLVGDIEAQPLVAHGTLLVETEDNYAYGLNPATGAIRWTDYFGPSWSSKAQGCNPASREGIAGTPVVMKGVEYFLDKAYADGKTGVASYYAQAVNATTGIEQPGFPRAIVGAASNDSRLAFDATAQFQQPGLVETQGVVYAAFGSSCERGPSTGWIVGISQRGKITAMWSTMAGSGASSGHGGISAPGALRSDGLGHLIVVTGSGDEPELGASADTSGAPSPAKLGDAVIRLNVNTDGSLVATDFFIPFDATHLDRDGTDLGSGAPILLPQKSFSTPKYSHLAVEIGKEGYLYVLDASHLGGWQQGVDGGDAVLARLGPVQGVWGDPAVWTGNGGYLYFVASGGPGAAAGGAAGGHLMAWKFGVDRAGNPTFSEVGQSLEGFAYGSSSPVVTSNGTTSGSALVWVNWASYANPTGAQLQAYSAVPDENGKLDLVWSAPSGTASTLSTPGVAAGRVYVGGSGGVIKGFGASARGPVAGGSLQFAATALGGSSTATDTFTATVPLTVTQVAVTGSGFSRGTITAALPRTVGAGRTFSVPITFSPGKAGSNGGTVTVTTSAGSYAAGLEGTGLSGAGFLTINPSSLSFEGVRVDTAVAHDVELSNQGDRPVRISSVSLPASPFTVTGLPAKGRALAPGASVSLTVTFAPTAVGQKASQLVLHTESGISVKLTLSGPARGPGVLAVGPASVVYPTISPGESETKLFTVLNTGGSVLTIKASHPPKGGGFSAISTRLVGSQLQPGQSITEMVTFAPKSTGTFVNRWVLSSDGTSKLTYVIFTGKAS